MGLRTRGELLSSFSVFAVRPGPDACLFWLQGPLCRSSFSGSNSDVSEFKDDDSHVALGDMAPSPTAQHSRALQVDDTITFGKQRQCTGGGGFILRLSLPGGF